MFALLDRLDAWSTRLYGLDPRRLAREQDLRAALLRRLLLAAGAVAGLYLALGLSGVASGRFFPYDAIELIAVVAGCGWMLNRGHAATALVLPLVVFSHTASSVIARYGIASPAPALLLPTIVVCGLLVGRYFLGTWTAICGLLVLYIGWMDGPGPSGRGRDLEPVLFWSALFAATGWLVHLFAGHLERLLQLEHVPRHSVIQALGRLAADTHFEARLGRNLEVMREQLGARAVALWRADEAGGGFHRTLVADGGGSGGCEDAPAIDPATWRGLAGSGRAVRIGRTDGDPGRAALIPAGSDEAIVVPLSVGPAPIGWLVAGGGRAPRRAEERVELAEALSLQVTLLLELIRLADRDRRSMIVDERNRMAREIHDTLAQGFTGIVVQLNAAGEVLDADPARAREHLATARELARASLQEARRSVWALRPEAQERMGLAASLERTARVLTDGAAIELAIECDGETSGLGIDAEWEVLRIGQEAITNAVRHSGGRRIAVRLARVDGSLRLEVEDDGEGGLANDGPSRVPGAMGLRGMRERAGRVGGRLEILSPPGGPTRVTLLVPATGGMGAFLRTPGA